MRHGRTTLLAFAEEFFYFEDFSPLKMTEFSGPTIDTGRDDSQRSHEFRVSIALHDLR